MDLRRRESLVLGLYLWFSLLLNASTKQRQTLFWKERKELKRDNQKFRYHSFSSTKHEIEKSTWYHAPSRPVPLRVTCKFTSIVLFAMCSTYAHLRGHICWPLAVPIVRRQRNFGTSMYIQMGMGLAACKAEES